MIQISASLLNLLENKLCALGSALVSRVLKPKQSPPKMDPVADATVIASHKQTIRQLEEKIDSDHEAYRERIRKVLELVYGQKID